MRVVFLHRVLSTVFLLSAGLFPLHASALLTDGANAIDVLGQYDQTSFTDPVPVYTKGLANDGPNTFGLSAPYSIVFDATGQRFFVSDTTNNRVLVYAMNADGTFVDRVPDNILGQPNYYSNTAASTQNGVNVPQGLAYDSTNNRLFIAQSTGNRVTVYDVTAITNGENATNVLGQTTFTASTAATSQPGMRTPMGIAYDSVNNRLFVTHFATTANRVTMYDVTAITNGENATNVLGQTTYTASTAATTQPGMRGPVGVAYNDARNQLFVAMQTSTNRVTVYDIAAITNGENATNVLGQTTYTGITAATTQPGMNVPQGLAYDTVNNLLYVSQSTANRVTVYDTVAITNGENATNVLGQTTYTVATAAIAQNRMNFPIGLHYNSTNNLLFVSQQTNNNVTAYNVASITNGENAVDAIGQYDQTSFTSPVPVYSKNGANDGPNTFGLSNPASVALDPLNHRLFTTDLANGRILVYALNTDNSFPDRVPDNILGQGNYYTSTDASTQNMINNPRGLSYDALNNRLFVGDTTSNRVLVFDVTAITNGENATNVLGQTTFTGTSASNSQNGLNAPLHMDYDNINNLLFVTQSTGNRVTVYDILAITDGENAIDVLGQYDETNLTSPIPLYTKVGANNGPNRIGFSTPQGMEYDEAGDRFFISDQTNNRVLVYAMNADGTFVDRIPDNILGQPNFYSNTAVVQQGYMSGPYGMVYDAANNRLFVAQSSYNRVTTYDVASITDGENATNVLGQTAYTTTTAGVTQPGLTAPVFLAYDSVNNRLFISQGNATGRVTAYDVLAITDGENATNVLGQASYSSALQLLQQNGMMAPKGLAYDSVQNRLFVADSSLTRITVYDVASITNGENATNVLGSALFNQSNNNRTQNTMQSVQGLHYDSANNRLFVADSGSFRVTVFDVATITNGENATNLLGQAAYGSPNVTSTQAVLGAATGLGYDDVNNRLYVTDGSNRAMIYDVSSITDGENAVDLVGQYDETSYVSPVPEYSKTTANNGPNKFGFNIPSAVSVDTTTHRLFVSDFSNNRIVVYNLNANGTLVDHVPDNILGKPNYFSNTAATQQNSLSGPFGLLYDSTNNRLFAADSTNNRILLYDILSITDGENATNILGQTLFNVATAATTQNGMSAPALLSYDSTYNRLYAVEGSNNRISVYDAGLLGSTPPTERLYFFYFLGF